MPSTTDISDAELDNILNNTYTDDNSNNGYSTIGSEEDNGSGTNTDVSPSDDIEEGQSIDEDEVTDVDQPEDSNIDPEDSLSTDDDEIIEDSDEADSVDETEDDSTSEDDSDNDSEADEEPYTFQPLRADGKEYPIESIQELYTLASKGINSDRKWQEAASGRKIEATLKKNGLSMDDINLLVELKKGDKNAIASLLSNTDVDPLDIDVNALDGKYNPKDYSSDEFEVQLNDVVNRVKTKPRYDESVSVVMDKWDEQSKSEFYKNPKILELLNTDMQVNPQTGFAMYDKVMPLAEKMKALETGIVKSDLEYYQMAGSKIIQALQQSNQSKIAAENAKNESTKNQKKNISKKKKIAASSRGKSTPQKVVDVTELSDEELDALIENS